MSISTGAVVEAPRLKRSLTLGPCLGEGGEGYVFSLREHPGHVAKIYKLKPNRTIEDKIEALVQATSPFTAGFSAWPEDSLRHAREFSGFMMPAITDARPLHEIMTPASRLKIMPDASIAFLLQIATNIARAMTALHGAGFVIGDINTKNILFRSDATVRLIDIDSIQIGDGRRFRCPVAVPEYTAPELQKKDLSLTPRTTNTDVFALAILVYQLLAAGHHPFDTSLDMELTAAIRQHRHAFEISPLISSPLSVLGLDERALMSPGLVALMRSTFSRSGELVQRPAAKQFLDALLAMRRELRQCSANRRHQHLGDLADCPWCTSEKAGAPRLFGQPRPLPATNIVPPTRMHPASSANHLPPSWQERLWLHVVNTLLPAVMQFAVQVFLPFLISILSAVLWHWTLSPLLGRIPPRTWRRLGWIVAIAFAFLAAVPLVKFIILKS